MLPLIQIGLSARPLKKAELKKGIVTIERDIYMGVLKKWPDGSTIRPILRQARDDNSRQIKALSPILKEAVEIAETKKKFPFASTDQETVDMIENIPGSFGVTSLTQILSEGRDIHALTLDNVTPSVQACITGQYPITKRFYFVLPTNRSTQVNAFLDFVFSDEGAAILRQYGCYPVK